MASLDPKDGGAEFFLHIKWMRCIFYLPKLLIFFLVTIALANCLSFDMSFISAWFLLRFYYCLIDQANRYWHVCHAWLNTGTMMIKGQYVVNVSIYRCTFILFLGSLAYKAQIYVVWYLSLCNLKVEQMIIFENNIWSTFLSF